MKKASLFFFLVVAFVTAEASSKQWWYQNTLIDADGDGDPVSQQIDSAFKKKSPGITWSAVRPYVVTVFDCDDADPALSHYNTEACNFIDDNCNGQSDEGFVHYSYYVDANGDDYGDDGTIVWMCDAIAPPGYTASPPVTPDFTFTSLSKPLTNLFWIFNTELIFYDGKTFSYPLTGTLNSRIVALQPTGFMYCGSPSHYVQYFAGDTVNTAPRGFNPIYTTNKQTGYNAAWQQSCFPSTVTLAKQCNAGILLQSSPTRNCDVFLSQLSWMRSKGVAALGLLVDQEYSDANWDNCANCGNGDAVAGDGTYWFGCVSETMQGTPFIIDAPYSLTAPMKPTSYGAKILNTQGYDSQRFYWAPSKGTPNLSASMSIEQLADSFDYGIDVMLPRIVAAASRSAFCTSLYPEDIDPRGGRLASAGTWLNNYFVAKSYIQLQRQPAARGAVFGRFDLLDVKPANGPNSLYYALQMMAPYFRSTGNLWNANETSNVIAVESGHHGYVLAVNRTGIAKDVSYLSFDGYVVPVTGIVQQVGTGLSDTNPQIRDTPKVEGYSIAIIQF